MLSIVELILPSWPASISHSLLQRIACVCGCQVQCSCIGTQSCLESRSTCAGGCSCTYDSWVSSKATLSWNCSTQCLHWSKELSPASCSSTWSVIGSFENIGCRQVIESKLAWIISQHWLQIICVVSRIGIDSVAVRLCRLIHLAKEGVGCHLHRLLQCLTLAATVDS